MKQIDLTALESVSGGVYAQVTGPLTYAPELAGMRKSFDDGSDLQALPGGWLQATEGVGPREVLWQYREQGGPMSINSAQSVARNRSIEMLASEPNVNTVYVEASRQVIEPSGSVRDTLDRGGMTRASLGTVYDDGGRLVPDRDPRVLPVVVPTHEELEQQITEERANATTRGVESVPSERSESMPLYEQRAPELEAGSNNFDSGGYESEF